MFNIPCVIETVCVSTFLFLSSATTKFNLLHLMFLITVVVFQSILLPFLSLYNPFSAQQPERSFYVINWIMLLPVLNLRMKFKPLCLAYTDLQDLGLVYLYNLVSHWSSPPPTMLQPRCVSYVFQTYHTHSNLMMIFYLLSSGLLLMGFFLSLRFHLKYLLRENFPNYPV